MIRRDSAIGLVRPAPVVEVEVSAQPGSRFRDAVVGPEIHLLVLDGLPQPVDEDVVAPAALTVHRDLDVMGLEHRSEGQAGELAALVGVEDLRCPMAAQGLFQRLDAEVRLPMIELSKLGQSFR